MGHDHCPEDAHRHVDAAAVYLRNDESRCEDRPVRLDDDNFNHIADADNSQETDDDCLQPVVSLTDDQHNLEDYGEQCPKPERGAKEQIEPYCTPQQFSDICCDAGENDSDPEKSRNRTGKVFTDIDGQGLAGGNSQLGRHMLDDDEHDSAEGNDPQQVIAVLRAALNIGGPVSRVDEADGYQESRAKKAQDCPEGDADFLLDG